jgi:hypothetical protein
MDGMCAGGGTLTLDKYYTEIFKMHTLREAKTINTRNKDILKHKF